MNTTQAPHAKSPRLDRNTWLERALDFLADSGGRLRISELVTKVGVSKGSFYWHFRDREDFIQSVLEYWEQHFTTFVPEIVEAAGGTPEERLLALMQLLEKYRLARYDIAVRALAAKESLAAEVVDRVDEFRMGYVQSLFAEMDLPPAEAEMRAQTFIVFHSLAPAVSTSKPKPTATLLKRRHALFVSKLQKFE